MSYLDNTARTLGGHVASRALMQVVCPGPGHSARDRSLSVFIDPNSPDGFRVHPHAPGDDWRECRDHVKRLLGIDSTPKARRKVPRRSRVEPDVTSRTARALALWNEAQDPRGSAVEAYLSGRGLPLPAEAAGAAIRFHPSCPFRLKDGSTVRLPAMVTLMRDIVTKEACGIHRTALKPDGSGKADMPDGSSPKKMYGRAKSAVVKLTADDDVTLGLGIVEGLETGLAIMAAGWRPMWVALSAGGIRDFPLMGGLEALTIFADADLAGLAAAQSCQARWLAAKRECPIVLPPHDGTDWADWRTT